MQNIASAPTAYIRHSLVIIIVVIIIVFATFIILTHQRVDRCQNRSSVKINLGRSQARSVYWTPPSPADRDSCSFSTSCTWRSDTQSRCTLSQHNVVQTESYQSLYTVIYRTTKIMATLSRFMLNQHDIIMKSSHCVFLPYKMKLASSTASFIKNLKTYLFCVSYNWLWNAPAFLFLGLTMFWPH